MRYLTLEEVVYIYTELIQRTGGKAGITSEETLESVLTKPLITFEGEELYPDLFTKAAVFLYAMISSRPFVDGNKRVALACTVFLLRANGYHLSATQTNIVDIAIGVEQGKYQVDQLIIWLQKNATPV